jgi:sulfonate transport system substrate-binding protein
MISTRMTRLFAAIAIAAATTAASAWMLVGCSRHSDGPALTEVRIALPADWITWLPVQLAQSLGYARQEGLDLTIAETNALGKGMEALLGGSVDVTAGTLSQAMQLAVNQRDVRCFVSLYARSPIALVVAPAMTRQIRDIADLKGHRVGMASPGSASHQFLEFLLASHGLSSSDVDAIALGTGAPSVAALEHGTVDAGILLGAAIPTFERKHPGAVLLVDTRTAEGTTRVFGTPLFPNACLIAQDAWLTTHVDLTRRLVRAVTRAMQWMGSHSAEEVRASMPATSHIADTDAELAAIRQAQATLLPGGAMPTDAPELVRTYVSTFVDKTRLARIDVAKTYTNAFVPEK